MRVSVVVPVLNEERTIARTLAALLPMKPDELFVVDGGSSDGTWETCRSLGVEILTAPRGRAAQMNYGAGQATGDVLLFLHADTRLPPTAFSDMRDALGDPRCVGGRFDVQLDSDHWMLRVIGAMISLRSRLSKVGTGDQGIFVRREVFQRMGGFPEIPLMEDIAFCRALKRLGAVACLKSKVITSARRWELNGVWRSIFRMWTLKSLYLLGVSPHRLKRFYDDAR
ncbi:MAG TPA: TIGR04283 family arsenosugar biosynthesis glycosyltransferase [Candidatus Binatia bacterium]|jgi:rSAM/selenodomain-associated transferase 2